MASHVRTASVHMFKILNVKSITRITLASRGAWLQAVFSGWVAAERAAPALGRIGRAPLARGPAAVDRKHDAGHVGGLVRREEENGLGDLARLADAAEKRVFDLAPVERLAGQRRGARADRAGCQRVHADVMGAIVVRDAAREADK